MIRFDQKPGPVPGFLESKNRRQKARAAGMNPDYWYPVERSKNLKRGKVVEVKFWGRSIAVYRDEKGEVHAMEDRCAHRQLKLSIGHVKGCNLVCMYHGWEYDKDGKVVGIPHDLFGKQFPSFKVQSFPVQERYGLIWVFPGNPELAKERTLPYIPELEGPDRWGLVSVDFTWRGHHSMIIDNVSDFSHAYLHRKYKPFDNAKMTRLESIGDKVFVEYDTPIGGGKVLSKFVNRNKVQTDHITLCYEYPYQWSNTGDKIKHHCFVLPIDEKNTRSFYLFYFKTLQIPVINWSIPSWLLNSFLQIAKHAIVTPIIDEDGIAVEAEQEGYDTYYDAPIAELNPAVNQFQQLTIRKWEEYVTAQAHKPGAGANLVQIPTTRAANS